MGNVGSRKRRRAAHSARMQRAGATAIAKNSPIATLIAAAIAVIMAISMMPLPGFSGTAYADEGAGGNASFTLTARGVTVAPQDETFTVTFEDWDGTELSSAQYASGTPASDIVAPGNPTRAEDDNCTYEFAGWKAAGEKKNGLKDVTGNAVYTAQYQASYKDDGVVVTVVNEKGVEKQFTKSELKALAAAKGYTEPASMQYGGKTVVVSQAGNYVELGDLFAAADATWASGYAIEIYAPTRYAKEQLDPTFDGLSKMTSFYPTDETTVEQVPVVFSWCESQASYGGSKTADAARAEALAASPTDNAALIMGTDAFGNNGGFRHPNGIVKLVVKADPNVVTIVNEANEESTFTAAQLEMAALSNKDYPDFAFMQYAGKKGGFVLASKKGDFLKLDDLLAKAGATWADGKELVIYTGDETYQKLPSSYAALSAMVNFYPAATPTAADESGTETVPVVFSWRESSVAWAETADAARAIAITAQGEFNPTFLMGADAVSNLGGFRHPNGITKLAVISSPDKAALQSAIETASQDLTATPDGEDASKIAAGTTFAAAADKQALQAAIDTAQGVLDAKSGCTQSDVDLAVLVLTDAFSAFRSAKQQGTYVPTVDISKATVKPAKTKYTYTGKAIKPAVTVKLGTTKLVADKDFTVKYASNKNAGTATITVTGKGAYSGSAKATFKIAKATPKAAVSAKTVKYASVKKKAQSVAPISVTKGAGAATFAKVAKGSSKLLSVNKRTGKVTVAKGTKKGTYRIKVKVTVKANANYAKLSKTVTATVRVK